MKKLIRTVLIIALAAVTALTGGCKYLRKSDGGYTQIDIPTTGPTDIPAMLSIETINNFLGDWYGTFTVSEAKGRFAPNANVQNDCAMRVSVDGYGKGSCFLQVNGMGRSSVSGSSNLFALCTAAISGNSLNISGMIDREAVDWCFDFADNKLTLVEVYGDVADHMRIEIVLVRPDDAIAMSSICPQATDYFIKHGCADAIDLLGGSTGDLPVIIVPEGCEPHIFFTGSSHGGGPAAVTSTDGHFSVILPEGYSVAENTVISFKLTAPAKNVESVEFKSSAWEGDSLSFLLSTVEDATDLYHYSIDGFDFYGVIVQRASADPGEQAVTDLTLFGTNGSGNLITIVFTVDMSSFAAYNYFNVDNEDFETLILNARFIFE